MFAKTKPRLSGRLRGVSVRECRLRTLRCLLFSGLAMACVAECGHPGKVAGMQYEIRGGAMNVSAGVDSRGEKDAASGLARIPVEIVVANTPIASISQRYLGLAYAKSHMVTPTRFFVASNTRAVTDFRALGTGVLRLVTGDSEQWNPAGKGQTAGEISDTDVRELAGFLKATGWQCIYSVNYKTGSPAKAAAEARSVAQRLGPSLLAFEIGNEPDAYSDVRPEQFAEGWNRFAAAIRAAVPGAQFAGPSLSIGTNVTRYTRPFMEVNGPLVSLDTTHFYLGPPSGAGATRIATLLEAPEGNRYFESGVAQMKELQAQYAAPWVIDETSDTYDGGEDGVSNTYASALYVLDFSLYAATRGVKAVNFISGSLGHAANPYSVIQDDSGQTFGVEPRYAGLYMFRLATEGQPARMLLTTVSAGAAHVTSYTLAHPDGSLSTVVVNRSSSALEVALSLPRAVHQIRCVTMTDDRGPGDQLTANIRVQGEAMGETAPRTLPLAANVPVSGEGADLVVAAMSAVVVKAR